jgi:murein DD-endopeptidase MepM/ murein hydrolase activator NlpD
MGESKYVTIMLVPDGTEPRQGIRVRRWVLKLAVVLTALILVGIIAFFSVYGSVLSRAIETGRLRVENEQLRRYQYKVQLLEQNLNETRDIVTRLAALAGIDVEFPELPDDSTLFASMGEKPGGYLARPADLDLTVPSGMPVQGFISRDFEIDNPEHYHPGIDIACAEGTPVLATASGVVESASFDSTLGNLLVLRHSDSMVTVYGHSSQLFVDVGQLVPVGGRIALSGNTGQSTAPHVHYEIRKHNQPINPLDSKYDEKAELR